MNPDLPASCCATRPGRFRGDAITDIPELSALVKPLHHEPGTQVLHYVCSVCGQQWEDHLVPMMHADAHVVVKAGVPATLDDSPGVWPPPTPPSAPPPKSTDQRILFVCIAASAVVGLATRPPMSQGRIARQDWLLLALAAGAVSGILLVALRRAFRKS